MNAAGRSTNPPTIGAPAGWALRSRRLSVGLGIDRDIAERLAADPSNAVRAVLADWTRDPQLLLRLARDPVENVRCSAAANDHASQDIVRLLGSDARANVRSCVANRRNYRLTSCRCWRPTARSRSATHSHTACTHPRRPWNS